MKTFLIAMLFIIAFTSGLFAQISVFNEGGSDTRVIRVVYDIDSAATLTSKQFSLDDFDGGLGTLPASFFHNQTSDGAPATTANISVILQGVYYGSSTYDIDSVQGHWADQGVDDTVGVLTFKPNGVDITVAPVYQIVINNTGGNASGVTVLTFPLREHPRVSDLNK
jgi:hypothetical protein